MNLIKYNCKVCILKIRASIPHLGMSKVEIEILKEGLRKQQNGATTFFIITSEYRIRIKAVKAEFIIKL